MRGSFGLLCVTVLCVSCIQPDLVPCGARSCPVGDICVASECATPAQVAACADATPGDPCSIASSVGRCDAAGVCDVVGCGNGVLDPGEVCDDHNAQSGDGCSGTCNSDESCGNGVLDVVAGESCDCGSDAAHVPSNCTMPNSDDPAAPCSASCKLRTCGDGAVDGPEQCDGSVLGTATCASFGYYRGAPTCSPLCQLDPSTCSGRCGDGTPDVGHEDCDGAPPPSETCLDFGFDLGAIGCSPVCTPGLSSCDRFGWARIHPRIEAGTQVCAAGGLVTILYTSGFVALFDNQSEHDPLGTFTAVAGGTSNAYAVGPGVAQVYAAATGWTALSSAPWMSTPPTSAWASDALGLMVTVAGPTNHVFHWTGTAWAPHLLPMMMANPRFGGSRTNPYVVDVGTHVVAAWNGTAFVLDPGLPPGVAPIFDFADTSTGERYAAMGSSLELITSGIGIWTSLPTSAIRLITNSRGGVDALTQGGTIARVGQFEVVAPAGTVSLAEDGGRSYAVGTPAGAFGLLKGDWRTLSDPDAPNHLYTYVHPYRTGGIMVAGPTVSATTNLTAWTPTFVGAYATDALLPSDFKRIVGNSFGVEVTPNTGPGAILDLNTIDPVVLSRQTNVVFAGGAGLTPGTGGVATIQLTPTVSVTGEYLLGADIKGVDGRSKLDMYAVGDDGMGHGVVSRWDGATWTTVDTSPEVPVGLVDVFVVPSGADTGAVFAVGGSFLYRYLPSTMQWTHFEIGGARLRAVSGTSAKDIFVVGDAQFGFPFTGLAHWDGTNLYPVRVPVPGRVHDVYCEAGKIAILVEDEASSTDTVLILARTTSW